MERSSRATSSRSSRRQAATNCLHRRALFVVKGAVAHQEFGHLCYIGGCFPELVAPHQANPRSALGSLADTATIRLREALRVIFRASVSFYEL